mmetsp:Transcript_127129/g.220352  ORF Transcript_127129/g.220352 Transcript_127129/m.220352 type:complete len:202 (+) Transcript_127129:2096-2701(+)
MRSGYLRGSPAGLSISDESPSPDWPVALPLRFPPETLRVFGLNHHSIREVFNWETGCSDSLSNSSIKPSSISVGLVSFGQACARSVRWRFLNLDQLVFRTLAICFAKESGSTGRSATNQARDVAVRRTNPTNTRKRSQRKYSNTPRPEMSFSCTWVCSRGYFWRVTCSDVSSIQGRLSSWCNSARANMALLLTGLQQRVTA